MMRQTECYEPEFIRQYLLRYPQVREKLIAIRWRHETRHSLLLVDPACCKTLLDMPDAFSLNTVAGSANSDHPPLSARHQTLNQAALDIVALPALSVELRLYALGIMLSYAGRFQEDDAPAVIATLPPKLAQYAREGVLRSMFDRLPPIFTLQHPLINRLGEMTFDWSLLPESARKNTLPLQLSLLRTQNQNSAALLRRQLADVWQSRGAPLFAASPWRFTNYLFYRLYHETFPYHDSESALQRYLALTVDYFLLRSLFCLWLADDSPLTDDDIAAIIAMFESWRHAPSRQREQLMVGISLPGNELLSAFSLLTR